tara:strand:+ start:17 stop:406 length:390 start_codon:yes stop_codon:yes gene_type:complete
MKVIKIEYKDDPDAWGNYWLFVQTSKEQSVDYGYISSTKHTYVSHGAGFVTIDIANGIRACEYDTHDPNIWGYIQRLVERKTKPKAHLTWTTLDDDSNCIKLSDHIDIYEGLEGARKKAIERYEEKEDE